MITVIILYLGITSCQPTAPFALVQDDGVWVTTVCDEVVWFDNGAIDVETITLRLYDRPDHVFTNGFEMIAKAAGRLWYDVLPQLQKGAGA